MSEERLTIKGFNFNSDFIASRLQTWPIAQGLNRLSELEDITEGISLDRLKEICEAEREKRVMIWSIVLKL